MRNCCTGGFFFCGGDTLNEEVILVDIFDHELGSGEKLEVHRQKKLHRAFSLFIADKRGNILLQKRAEGKYHSAGLWCNACCSHPRTGERTRDAVIRRAKEELGIDVDPYELFHFTYYEDFGDLAEYELDHVFLAQYEGELHPDPEEVAEIRWIHVFDLKEELEQHPERFAAWFQIAAPRVLENSFRIWWD